MNYRDRLLADVLEHAEQEGQESFLVDAFTDLVLEGLEEDGHWPDYQLSRFSQRGAAVDAWGYDETQQALYLAIADFDRASEKRTIPPSELQTLFKRLGTFLELAKKQTIEVQDHSPLVDLLDFVSTAEIAKVEFYVLTHRESSKLDLGETYEGEVPVARMVWDLETIRRSRETGLRQDPIDIDFTSEKRGGLPYLDGGSLEGVHTYLLFIPADLLAEIYHQYGGRILERNVRAFLSARGKVNQGIRDTLRNEPERFLAYNNGITATAASVDMMKIKGAESVISSATDLQIVNGGQTTASIATAARDPEVDLTSVLVQVKLAVVNPELLDEMVPNISRYANRQNAVQESDLSANHEFLTSLQAVSRSEWTPTTSFGRPTKWYFERARGSYNVDKVASGTQAQQKKFEQQYPKNQKFDKNNLALFWNTWAKLPHFVCRGGQKNFVEFMLHYEAPPADQPDFDIDGWYQTRFREVVGKGIVFKSADTAIRKALGGTYKRAVVAYTVAYLVEHAKSLPSPESIWRDQQISEQFVEAIVDVAGPLKERLIDSASGQNITEWAKKEGCWQVLSESHFDFDEFAKEKAKRSSTISLDRSTSALSLAEAIEQVHGESIDGNYKRYRRRKWRHMGDTGIPASTSGTLHVYSAPFVRKGEEYIFSVVVDFDARDIADLDSLDSTRRDLITSWLSERGFSGV